MKPTIKMIAELAGVSRGTVDRVIHNRPNVNPEIREHILGIIEELDYRPNTAARALALKDKNITFGIIVPNWKGHFRAEITRGIEAAKREVDKYGVSIVVEYCETQEPEMVLEKINHFVENDISGLAISAINEPQVAKRLAELKELNIPVVTFNSDINGSGRVAFVAEDIIKSGRTAAEIMSKLWDRNTRLLIGCADIRYHAHMKRVQGFLERFAEIGVTEDRFVIVETRNRLDLTYRYVKHELSNNSDVTAVYMANEDIGSAAKAIKEVYPNKKIPLVTHDISEEIEGLLIDGVLDFTISQDLFEQGYKPIIILSDYLFSDMLPSDDLVYTETNIITSQNI